MLLNTTVFTYSNTLKKIATGGCEELTSKDLQGCSYIANYAFDHTQNLRKITLPSSVGTIHSNAFSSCDVLDTVILDGNTVKTLESITAFQNTPIYLYGSIANYTASSAYKLLNGVQVPPHTDTGTDISQYHSGKLNDGVISTVVTSSSTNNIEFSMSDYRAGTVSITFKLPRNLNITQVVVHTNDRLNNASTNRGYPREVSVYCSSADVTTVNNKGTLMATALQSAATLNGTDMVFRLNPQQATHASYVTIDCRITPDETATSECVIAISEIEIFGIPVAEFPVGIYVNDDLVSAYKASTQWCELAAIIKPKTELT